MEAGIDVLIEKPVATSLAEAEDLIAMAQAMPGGTKVQIPDRLTAIVLILGTRPLDSD